MVRGAPPWVFLFWKVYVKPGDWSRFENGDIQKFVPKQWKIPIAWMRILKLVFSRQLWWGIKNPAAWYDGGLAILCSNRTQAEVRS